MDVLRNGILVSPGKGRHKNIGDYIQSIAARQFAGSDPLMLHREHLDEYSGEKVRTVMNAWFMSNPRNFPPSPSVNPLFVSFHVTPPIEKEFFTPRTIEYLKRYEPIGCRSEDVVDMLERHGISGKFTSCLTLTLGRSYRHHEVSTARPIFVDPFYRRPAKVSVLGFCGYIIKRTPYILGHFRAVKILAHRFRVFSVLPCSRFAAVRWAYAAEFHRAYTSFFTEEVLLTAEYVTHKLKRRPDFCDEVLMNIADEMLHYYEKAPFVVTSRLHCALPCTAMGTPVWVVFDQEMATGRFRGNLNFLNILRLDSSGRIHAPIDGKIGVEDRPPVRTDHIPYADALSKCVTEFFER